ncbi:hypothetical protein ILUMI_08364 [Ignelater luminosus]|uniref:Conserved oligomeric Golgi complex subunit 2 n=1 Tax=Ignelater luminosus TaxID=2038154 RepID=A0A8K0GH38_IGNLU|nr:hypothetical protein ILUMI_08364 [Ignelater luminosus]
MDPAKQNMLLTEEFFKDTFIINDYLSKCTQKLDLLTLRRDLKNYGSVLHAKVVDILKMETVGIANLIENLTDLNSKVDDLSVPVTQLSEEIRTLYLTIKDTKQHFEKRFNRIQLTQSEIDGVNLKMKVLLSFRNIESVIASCGQEDVAVLEHAVNEYSFCYLCLQEVDIDSKYIDEDVMNTAAQLLESINNIFLKGIQENDEELILRNLRMYENLNKQSEAEKCVREKMVCPTLNKILTRENLNVHKQNIKILYDKSMEFLNTNLKVLLAILDRNPDMKGFNFVINSFWLEVDKQLRENLPNITAPGNPEIFQRRFKDTWLFLEQIANAANDASLLKKDPLLQAHMKRFNLPVYFEVCFQQIAAQFEAALVGEVKQEAKDDMFALKISLTLWNCIQCCFHDDVFLVPLTDQFLKLMELLLSRYLKWLENYLTEYSDELEEFIVSALTDLDILKNLIGFSVEDVSALDHTILKIIPYKIRPPFKEMLNINKQLLNATYLKLQDQLIVYKEQQCLVYLRQVTSIPRSYRRTNKSVPTEPNSSVIEAVGVIIKLYSSYNKVMDDKIITLLDLLIIRLSEEYLNLIQEVLLSVDKTEESLRKLKNRNVTSNDDLVTQAVGDFKSDEAKIREQIKLDVEYFVQKLQQYATCTGKESLALLVEELKKKN